MCNHNLLRRTTIIIRRDGYWGVSAGVFLAVSGLLLAFRPDDISFEKAILAIAIIGIGIFPIMLWWIPKGPINLPVFEISCLFYVISFGLSPFLIDIIWLEFQEISVHRIRLSSRSDAISISALLAVLAGIIAYISAFYATKKFSDKYVPNFPRFVLPSEFSIGRLIILLWGLLLGNLAYHALPALREIPSIGQFLQPVGYVAVGMFYFLWRRRKIGRVHAALIFFVVFPLVLLLTLATSFLTPTMLWVIFLIFVLLFERKRVPIILCAASVVLLLLGYGPLGGYRAALGGHHHQILSNVGVEISPESSVWEKTQALATITANLWKHETPQRIENFDARPQTRSVSNLVRRISLLPLLSQVTARTPDPVPFWNGETYKPLLTSFIPRLLWSGKPKEMRGKEFGLRYGFLAEGEETSLNVPWIVEMFANFGLAGVILGMFFAGGIFAVLQAFFLGSQASTLETITGLSIIFPLVYQESNLSLMVGSIIPLTICLFLYFRVGLGVGKGAGTP